MFLYVWDGEFHQRILKAPRLFLRPTLSRYYNAIVGSIVQLLVLSSKI